MNSSVITIIDGGGANFTSVQAALHRLNVKSFVTSDPSKIAQAERVILPGVGAAGYGMRLLHEKGLIDVIRCLHQPVLGICLGQQLLCASSDENSTQCLDLIPIKVIKLENAKILPHMGWNNLTTVKNDEPLLAGITTKDDFYFVHSFAAQINDQYTVGICNYGISFSAVIRKDNFYGVQFHPEKSGEAGMKLLKNFIGIV